MAQKYLTVDHLSLKDLVRIFSKIGINRTKLYKGLPCWEWNRSLQHGYGQISWHGRPERVHRIIYAWLVEPLPMGSVQDLGKFSEVDHLCRNKACCNPVHLELVSHTVNHERGNCSRQRSATHCIRGHAFSESNTRWIGPSKSLRQCVACCAIRQSLRPRKVLPTMPLSL